MNSKKLIERLNELQKENRELKANCAIQEHVIKNRHNPMDIEKLQRLILENTELREELKSKEKLISQQAKELERRHTLLQEQEAKLERVKTERGFLRYFFKDITSKPDCNTCADKECVYRPRLGMTTRFNCPLWQGGEPT